MCIVCNAQHDNQTVYHLNPSGMPVWVLCILNSAGSSCEGALDIRTSNGRCDYWETCTSVLLKDQTTLRQLSDASTERGT